MSRFRRIPLAVRLTMSTMLAVLLCLAGGTAYLTKVSADSVESEASAELSEKCRLVARAMSTFGAALRSNADRLLALLAERFPGSFTLDEATTVAIGTVATPTLSLDGAPLNLSFDRVDAFTLASGGTRATVFARTGDDFVRIATSLKKENGDRAIGTPLGKAHPAHAALLRGEGYVGRAQLFGRDYMTAYRAVKDAEGKVVGALFIGLDFSDEMKQALEGIAKTRIGRSGRALVVDIRPGATQGTMVVHPERQGVKLVDWAHGKAALDDMMQRREGSSKGPPIDQPDAAGAEALLAFQALPDWNWMVAATIPMVDVRALSRTIGTVLQWTMAALLVVVAAVMSFSIRRMVGRPIARLVQQIQRIGAGDCREILDVRREDEIGQIERALAAMQRNISALVNGVQCATGAVHAAASEIAAGHHDLGRRTESQAASLEETAAGLAALTSTVGHTAAKVNEASALAAEARTIAVRSGTVVHDVVEAIDRVAESSARIEEIVGIIDGIAFQTNMLALNAAVEAARAGQQGRGFAVVAGEIRSLARQSAKEAKHIREIIEVTRERSEAGRARAHEAGETMNAVLASITKVAEIASGIAGMARTQATSVGEASTAVSQMEAVTQQNAALVEEATAAATSLERQVEDLRVVAHRFQVSDPEPAPA